MSASPAPWWHRRAATLRVVIGCIVGIAILAVLLRIRSEVHRAGGVLSTVRGDNRGVFSLAVALGREPRRRAARPGQPRQR